MPALSNPKHERFAQDLAKGKTADEAYQSAGYSPSRKNASRLKTNEGIQSRVAEIVDRGAIRTEITLASLMAEAAEIQAAAMKVNQHSAAIAALTAKAKLAGLWVEKNENTNRNAEPDQMSDDEIKSRLAELRSKRDGTRGDAASRIPRAPQHGQGKPH